LDLNSFTSCYTYIITVICYKYCNSNWSQTPTGCTDTVYSLTIMIKHIESNPCKSRLVKSTTVEITLEINLLELRT